MRLHLPILALSLAIASYPDVVLAQWVPDGVALSTATHAQSAPTIVSDGSGGAIVTWQDFRSGTNYDIYAQRVNASGVPQWMADGEKLCIAMGDQQNPQIVSDGAGGAIVTWQDARGGVEIDIFAQRVNALGVPQWMVDGVKVCTAANDQLFPSIASDGFGGAIVTWRDRRSGDYDVYAQRMSEHGERLWTDNGIALCIDPRNQFNPVAVSDGTGGAIVAWDDFRIVHSDIYAQRLNASGTPKWETNGVAICAAVEEQRLPVIVSDGAGGAIVVWEDARTGAGSDVYAQRVNDTGTRLWMADGIALSTAEHNQSLPAMVSDGAGGAIVAWWDDRSLAGPDPFHFADIYVQRVNETGAPLWTTDGVALCTAEYGQFSPALVLDGAGGAIVTWYDFRSDPYSAPPTADIYARRVDASGVPQWATDGVALCTAPRNQGPSVIASDGAGGAIVAWDDFRSTTNHDVYAQRVVSDGGIPTSVGDTRTPSLFALSPNFPNPFSVATTIDLSLDAAGAVEVEVFDVAGQRVRTIELGHVDAESKRMSFDGRDESGRLLPSGVYFCRVRANGTTVSRKMVIVR